MPTLPSGTVRVEHAWKRFRADRTLPMFQDQILLFGRWLRGYRRPYRWVLRDVNLHVEPGKTYGIIGVNGSGKSTLLKMICQTTFPSAGSVTAAGRVGALLEVRSGIHPDLSGRQNIYLYGNILGMSRADVSARFDDIVEFAEIGEAVDRQVKFYSTGMAIRLGFAIAAFLEPDVLLVDEVLAVGDARFQQKCLERISQVVANGTTLFYVSHDLPTVEAVCDRAMWLADSYVRADGPAREVVSLYRQSVGEQAVLAAVSTASAGDVLEAVGLDGALAARGRTLSGGQAQRIRLVRALLADPEILILIEPTSAVDAHTEAAIAASLRTARPGRSTVVVSNSPLLLDQADQVAFIVGGKVAALSTHRELIATNEAYIAAIARAGEL